MVAERSTQDTEVVVAHLLLEGYLQKFTTETAYTVQVYVKPAPSRNIIEGQKLVVQLQLVPSDHTPARKRGRPRKVAPSPTKHKGDEEGDDDDDEYGDFGDCSGEDGEEEAGAAGPSEYCAGASPAKRRRSNHVSTGVPAPPRNATAAVIVEDSDPEWIGDVPAALPVTPRRSGRRPKAAQKQGKWQGGSRLRPSGAIALLDDEVIEISTD